MNEPGINQERLSSHVGLWTDSPFFGSRPETLVLIQLDLKRHRMVDTLLTIDTISRNLANRDSGDLRCQVGLGTTFFDRFPSLHRPRALRTLHLSDDAVHGLNPGSGESDLLIAVSGEWNGA